MLALAPLLVGAGLFAPTPTAAPGAAPAVFQHDAAADARARAGKAQLDELMSAGRGGTTCWREAVDALQGGCKGLDDVAQSRLAVRFANCHLAKSGLPTYPCEYEMSIEQCTGPMAAAPNGLPYTVYTTFYQHAESMCFYVQSEAFQARTEHAVASLHGAVDTALSGLDELAAASARISHGIDAAAARQAEAQAATGALAGQIRELSAEEAGRFERTATSLHGLGAMASASAETMERLHAAQEAFATRQAEVLTQLGALLELHAAFLGEFFDLKAAAFYTLCVFAAVLLSSTKRTAGARSHMLAVLGANWTLERLVIAISDLGSPAGPEAVHARLWALRRLALCTACLAAARALLRWSDPAEAQAEAMAALQKDVREIRRQSSDLSELLAGRVAAGGGGSAAGSLARARSDDAVDGGARRAPRAAPASAAGPAGAGAGDSPDTKSHSVSRSPVGAIREALERAADAGEAEEAAAGGGGARARGSAGRPRRSLQRTPPTGGARGGAAALQPRRGSAANEAPPGAEHGATARVTRSAARTRAAKGSD